MRLLSHLVARHRAAGSGNFYARYRPTQRNAPGGRVFDDLGFELRESEDGVDQLVLPAGRVPQDEGLVEIVEAEGTQ